MRGKKREGKGQTAKGNPINTQLSLREITDGSIRGRKADFGRRSVCLFATKQMGQAFCSHFLSSFPRYRIQGHGLRAHLSVEEYQGIPRPAAPKNLWSLKSPGEKKSPESH